MQQSLEQQNRQLNQEIIELKTSLAHWQLQATLGSADYERMQTAEDEYKELFEIVSEGIALSDLSSKDVGVINSAIAVLNDVGYF